MVAATATLVGVAVGNEVRVLLPVLARELLGVGVGTAVRVGSPMSVAREVRSGRAVTAVGVVAVVALSVRSGVDGGVADGASRVPKPVQPPSMIARTTAYQNRIKTPTLLSRQLAWRDAIVAMPVSHPVATPGDSTPGWLRA